MADARPPSRGHAVHRVLYVTAARELSGGSRQILHNVHALLAHGLRVTVAAPPESALFDAARLTGACVVEWKASGALLAAAHQLRAVAREARAEVVHACHTRAVKAAVLARVLGLRSRVFLNRGVVSPPNPLWGLFVRIADGAIANSAAAAATLIARYAPRSRVHVVYNSCPPPVASDSFPGRQAGWAADRANGDAPLALLWVGNAHPAKGFDVFAAAVALLRQRRGAGAVRAVALGVGAGDRHGVAALAGDAIALGGVVSHDEVRRALAAADVFVLTSCRRESLPNVVTEAFAAGLPVVATDVGGITELVRHGLNGCVCGAGDAEAVARHLAALVARPDERARMGAINRRLAAERLTSTSKGESLLRVYRGETVVEDAPVTWIDRRVGP